MKFIGIFFVICGVICIILSIEEHNYMKEFSKVSVEVEAEVTDVKMVDRRKNDNSYKTIFLYTYEYEYNDKTYIYENYENEHSSTTSDSKKSNKVPGDKVTFWIDPSNPEESVRDYNSDFSIGFSLIGLVLIVFGVYVFIKSRGSSSDRSRPYRRRFGKGFQRFLR